MVEEGWLTQEERTASVYPPVEPKAAGSLGIPAGPEGLIVQKAIEELEGKHGYDEQQIRAGGLRIVTTVDKGYQDAAVAARNEVMEGEPEPLKEALVAVDPRTGAVRAYYGGESGTGNDYADAQRQPGSSIKPYVLGAALEQGISVTARRDGSSPQTFQDREAPVRNSGGVSCPACTLREAITRSLNTTFYGLAFEVGPPNVAEFTRRATGLPEVWEGGGLKNKTTLANPNSGNVGSSIGIGEYEMRPIDQAVGFATFASGGMQRDPYFVARVNDSAGALLLETVPGPGEQVMSADIASDVTYAIKDVADYSKRPLEDGREVASKTGTVGSSDTNNSDAWMVGYTPSLSTAVWMGNDRPTDPIVNARGRIIYGSDLPGAIWQRFMSTVLAGTPEEDLPDKASFQGDSGEGVPEPTTEAPPSTSAAPAPTTAAPTPTVEETTTETSAPSTTASTTTGTSTPPQQGSTAPANGGAGGGGGGGQPRP
jgi:membrane peptidoglycan carboxypeptidase